jgi:hypothetical protein
VFADDAVGGVRRRAVAAGSFFDVRAVACARRKAGIGTSRERGQCELQHSPDEREDAEAATATIHAETIPGRRPPAQCMDLPGLDARRACEKVVPS